MKSLKARAVGAETVARIFEDVGGYHLCSDGMRVLWTEPNPSPTKADALRQAWQSGYTHAVGSGTHWDGIRAIPVQYRDYSHYADTLLGRIEAAERAFDDGSVRGGSHNEFHDNR